MNKIKMLTASAFALCIIGFGAQSAMADGTPAQTETDPVVRVNDIKEVKKDDGSFIGYKSKMCDDLDSAAKQVDAGNYCRILYKTVKASPGGALVGDCQCHYEDGLSIVIDSRLESQIGSFEF